MSAVVVLGLMDGVHSVFNARVQMCDEQQQWGLYGIENLKDNV